MAHFDGPSHHKSRVFPAPLEMAVGLWSLYGGLFTNFKMYVLSIARLLREVGRLGARKPVNHTSWMADVTPADFSKSIRNRCVIDYFCDVFVYFHI